uniref:Uncharacterized protein n=1 Tax=Cacopsylla melanoneura TaxID=428564 RepID=A0A8D9E326_9HEMI
MFSYHCRCSSKPQTGLSPILRRKHDEWSSSQPENSSSSNEFFRRKIRRSEKPQTDSPTSNYRPYSSHSNHSFPIGQGQSASTPTPSNIKGIIALHGSVPCCKAT